MEARGSKVVKILLLYNLHMQLPSNLPLYKQIEARFKPIFAKRIPKTVFGPTPSSVFIGRYGYPNVFTGPMVAINKTDLSLAGAPGKWYGFTTEKIIELNLSLARGEQTINIRNVESRLARDVRDAALSVKPVDLEVNFEKELVQRLQFSAYLQPMGASGKMEKLRLADNPKIPAKIEQLTEEKITVRTALEEGYSHGLGDVYYLQKLLSVGALGIEKKMVPTRWSITASDKMLADYYLETVKECRQLDEVRIYSNTYLGNHFEILMLPGAWDFEQFESWEPKSNWAVVKADSDGSQAATDLEHEYEPHGGRSDYAEREAGGYYAGRIACSEALYFMRRQARTIVFREISEDYVVPVGVFQVRENVRHALKKQPVKFENLESALAHLKTTLKRPMQQYLQKSMILRQKKLVDFT